MSDRRIGIIGVPTSAGAFAAGQERAPAALRDAGLTELIADAGLDLTDHGDREDWRWRPDRENRRAQNLGTVAEIVADTGRRVADSASDGELTLVLGGDCTVGIGTVAGHVAANPDGRIGLVYLDSHADLNVPESVLPGALDWMGLAHMLDEDGAARPLVEAGGRTPLLEPDQVVLVGWGPEQATAREREAIERLSIEVAPVDEVAADPAGAARRTLSRLEGVTDRVVVHFDVDLVDFTDTPLSENTGRNEGLAYEQAIEALAALLDSSAVAGLTITELNPEHAEPGGESIARLARDLARALGGPA